MKHMFESGGNEQKAQSFLEQLGFTEGDRATVQRSNGQIESDWEISGYSHNVERGETTIEVSKADPDRPGTMMRKQIPLETFKELNG